MIAIQLRFLAGRFHSTPWGRHVNEGVAEWPPSPWRLLRALIAVGRRARPDGVTEEHLQRLVEALSAPPLFHLPPAATAHTRHYDQANDGVKFFDTFVAVAPDKSVFCVWPDTDLSEDDRRALQTLLRALNTFGRAESWCEAELLSSENLPPPNCKPLSPSDSLSGYEPVRVLLPDAEADDLIKALTIETSDMRAQKMLDPPGARWVTYTRQSDALTLRKAALKRPARNKSKVTIARYMLDSTVLPLAQDAMPFGERVRRALIRDRVNTSHSEAIIGKTVGGLPLEGHLHAHYLSTDEDDDGRLDYVTLYAPCGFDRHDLAAIGALRTIFGHDNRPNIRLVLTALGEAEQFGDMPIFARSRIWRSMTPFSLPRFANRGGGKPPRPRDLPEGQLARELRLRGLPEPISIERIEGYTAGGRPLVRWLEFHARRFKGDQGNGLAGFEIEFAEAIQGPLALGFGCHFGLGLFLPV